MIDIPTLVDIKKQTNEILAKKEAEQLAVQKFFADKTQKGLDNLINACQEKAKKGEIQYMFQRYAECSKQYDALPACVDTDTIYTIVNELRKAGYKVEYQMDSLMILSYNEIGSLIIKW